ncbi:MAG: type II toxin-antitoxin system PemK/MazF family toxin [Candidatus Hydrogenedentota bacterium]
MRRGEVWMVNLNPTIGAEIKKTRPAVIVNDDAVGILPLKIIVPITEWKSSFKDVPWMVRIEPSITNGLRKVSIADAFQVRSISQLRLINKIGVLSASTMNLITKALALVLGME